MIDIEKIRELAQEILDMCDAEEGDSEETNNQDEGAADETPKNSKKKDALSLAIAFMPKKDKKK